MIIFWKIEKVKLSKLKVVWKNKENGEKRKSKGDGEKIIYN